MNQEWRLDTTESPASLMRRLRELVDPLPTVPAFRVRGRRPFLGTVWDDAFEIRRREALGKNDFGAVLRARIQATPDGSIISGSVGPQPMLKVLFWLFFALGLSLSVAGLVLALVLSGPGRFVLAIVGLGLLAIGSGVCGVFLLPSVWDRGRLIQEVERVLCDVRRTV